MGEGRGGEKWGGEEGRRRRGERRGREERRGGEGRRAEVVLTCVSSRVSSQSSSAEHTAELL